MYHVSRRDFDGESNQNLQNMHQFGPRKIFTNAGHAHMIVRDSELQRPADSNTAQPNVALFTAQRSLVRAPLTDEFVDDITVP